MSKRYEYGTLKAVSVRKTIVLKEDVLRALDRMRAGKSWGVFLEEVAAKLSRQT